ncbi:MAG: YkvA family protein [Methylocystaceae bacterium]
MPKSSAKGVVVELLKVIPNLLKLLYRLLEDPRIPKTEKVILAGVAAYVVSPLDLIPDFVPFLGKVDDLVLIALVLKRLFNAAGEQVLNEHWDGGQDLLMLVDRILEYALRFLPSKIYKLLVTRAGTDYIDITPRE